MTNKLAEMKDQEAFFLNINIYYLLFSTLCVNKDDARQTILILLAQNAHDSHSTDHTLTPCLEVALFIYLGQWSADHFMFRCLYNA